MKTIYDDRYAALIDLLRRRRLTLKMRQVDVAQRMGWQRNVLSKIELRERRIDALETVALGKILGISLRQIDKILNQKSGSV